MFLVKKQHIIYAIIIMSFVCLTPFKINAKEGMWLPPTLKKQENQMKALGLSIPIEEIYNTNGTGLNNAVVLFGRGCTGEIISPKGLLLTNHHCGYGTVQGLSSKEHDYFANGFFAKNNADELPCPGLTVTFIRKMENVTAKILEGIADTVRDSTRDQLIAKKITALEKEYQEDTHFDATIKPYYEGNQYWVSITETFTDVRLVAFPPNGIGTFGGDDENWVWPRHTGDFSVFRVYANAKNEPAPYNASNVPYKADPYFKIASNGYKEGDFTMVYGFPGTTQEYISSYELSQVYQTIDPISIEARTLKLDVWSEHMDADREVFLKYTSKRAGVANGWKKWQGEVKGLKANKATKKKQKYEQKFAKWANKQTQMPYAKTILSDLKKATQEVDDLIYLDQHIKEDVYGIELIAQSAVLEKYIQCYRHIANEQLLSDTLAKLNKSLAGFYKNYDMPTDMHLFKELMPFYMKNCGKQVPKLFLAKRKTFGKNYSKWAKMLFNNSVLSHPESMSKLAATASFGDSVLLVNDPAYQLYQAVTQYRKENILPTMQAFAKNKKYLNRLYIKAQMAFDTAKDFYPDANLTLRLTYGNVQGLDPEGKAPYSWQTNLDDVAAHHNPDVKWYTAPDKLLELQKNKNYGQWQANGSVPVAFVAVNHTSGGNSGSPVLNSKGALIGTNFDRAYEGTMSDYLFDPKRCRNISVDIRYTLFVLDKFGGAGWLLQEMNFVP